MSNKDEITKFWKIKETKRWSVWVGGVEVNDYYLPYKKAKNLFDEYVDDGYDDVILMSHDGT